MREVRFWRRARWLVATALLGIAAAGCSEKPLQQKLVWEPYLFSMKAALRGVVATSSDDLLTVGFNIPEHSLLAFPVSLQRVGGIWAPLPVPGHPAESLQLLDLARAVDGTCWACGAVTANPDGSTGSHPVVYRFDGGAWSEVALDELGDTQGVGLQALAISGKGADFELRAVGFRADQTGVAIRYRGGHWSWMSPTPPSAGPTQWTLSAIGRSPYGTWYAGGTQVGTLGATLYMDRGAGWELLAGPQITDLQFTDIAFDADGTPWFTANYPSGDVSQGILYALRGGTFVRTTIQRLTPGACQLYAVAFDVEGHGWVGGGHLPDDPFLAGNVTGKWVESVLEHEAPYRPPGGEVEGGGEIQSISVVSATSAVAVGQAEELGPEGYIEFVPRLFQLVPRPIGEIDKPALLTNP